MSDHNNKTHRQIIAFNKDIGHSYVPNLNARLLDDHGGYFIKTNSQGFRSDKEFSKKKSGRRILFFGDSIHTIQPLAGQGFNMTVRDIKKLIEILEKRQKLGLEIDKNVHKETNDF